MSSSFLSCAWHIRTKQAQWGVAFKLTFFLAGLRAENGKHTWRLSLGSSHNTYRLPPMGMLLYLHTSSQDQSDHLRDLSRSHLDTQESILLGKDKKVIYKK